MTQGYERERQDVRRATTGGAPWPLVERRARARPLEVGAPFARVPRQSRGPDEAPVRRVLDIENKTQAWWRSRVLLADLAGLVLLLAHGGDKGSAWIAVAVVWCLVLAALAVTAVEDGPTRGRAVLAWGVGLVVACAFLGYAVDADLPRGRVLLDLPAAVLLSATARSFPRPRRYQRVVLVGSPDAVSPTRALLAREGSVAVVGICCVTPSTAPSSIGGVPVVGDLDELAPTVWRGGVDAVVVCCAPETSGPVLRRLVWDLEASGVPVLVAPGIVELGPARLQLTTLAGLPLLRITDPTEQGVARFAKHAFDRSAAVFGLLALSPLLLGIAAAVRATTPGPALFRQLRVGREGRTFTVFKFRSMHIDAEDRLHQLRAENKHAAGPLFKVEHDPRITPLGRVLRRTSLDELPQLLNVARGEMSLVGPRPPLPSEVATYSDAVPRRLMVRPGLTGLWQVSGRADLDWDESARLDLWYVENWSLGLDLSILRRTVNAVLRGRGAY